MDSFNEIFETYKNMRGRSEIEVEIAEVKPQAVVDWGSGKEVALEEPGLASLDDTVFYSKGYIDALRWVIGVNNNG